MSESCSKTLKAVLSLTLALLVLFYLLITHVGEGNGNSHQYSCLENPRDRGACRLWGRTELDMTEATWYMDLVAAAAACWYGWSFILNVLIQMLISSRNPLIKTHPEIILYQFFGYLLTQSSWTHGINHVVAISHIVYIFKNNQN